MTLTATGCSRLPLRQVEATPSARATTRVEPAAPPPAELPPLPATPITDARPRTPPAPDPAELLPVEESNRSTPLLDAALAKASEAKVMADPEKPIELPILSAPPEDPKHEPKMAVPPPAQAPQKVETTTIEISADSMPKTPPIEVVEPTPIEPLPEKNNPHPPESHPKEPAAKPIDPEKPALTKVSDPWLDGLGDLRAFAARHAGESGEKSETWIVRSRVLDWLAAEPNAGPADTAWTDVLSALVAATGPETIDRPTLIPKIQEAIGRLESLSPLAIVDLKLCRKVQGFGHREALEPAAIRVSQPLLVYCEISGLRYEPISEGFQSRLTSTAEIVRAEGGEPVWSQELGAAEDVCRTPRRDYFINYRIPLPATLTSGDYQLRLTQRDLLTGRDASAVIAFRIIP